MQRLMNTRTRVLSISGLLVARNTFARNPNPFRLSFGAWCPLTGPEYYCRTNLNGMLIRGEQPTLPKRQLLRMSFSMHLATAVSSPDADTLCVVPSGATVIETAIPTEGLAVGLRSQHSRRMAAVC